MPSRALWSSAAALRLSLQGHVMGWVFPEPTGGIVTVSYPFIFKPT